MAAPSQSRLDSKQVQKIADARTVLEIAGQIFQLREDVLNGTQLGSRDGQGWVMRAYRTPVLRIQVAFGDVDTLRKVRSLFKELGIRQYIHNFELVVEFGD
jgi:hypothetical protein